MHAILGRRYARGLCAALLPVAVLGQTVPPVPAASSNTANSNDPLAELSPFEVRAERAVGYQAGHSVSGCRMSSQLKYMPASVSPFTPVFLSDIAAMNLQEMLAHATYVEVELEDSQAGFNNPPGRDSTGGEYSFRVRGIVGGISRDFV